MNRRGWLVLGAIALIIAGVLAIILGTSGSGGEIAERTRSTGLPLTVEQQSVDFQTADLSFEVFPDRKAIDGKAVLGFAVLKPIDKLQFDLDPNLPITSIFADGKALDETAWRNVGGQVTVDLPQPKKAGDRLSLAVAYGGKPHVAVKAPWDGGFVWSETPEGKPWIATAIQGEGCDMFWPCFDNSLVEIGTVDLHITVPEGLSAPSNGRLIGTSKAKDGRQTFHWRTHRPNNYAIALNIAPYKSLSAPYKSRFGNTIPMMFWYLPGEEEKAKRLFTEFAPTLDFFESTVGPYPFGTEKVGAVLTPHLGMEHQTINAYGNEYKPAAEGYDWLFSHEFSHEWFGNQLTNRDWDDMWLHEGFGSYMQPLFLRWRDGELAYKAAMFKQRQGIANKFPMVSGHHRLEHEVYDDKTGPANDIYVKGSWILHTLRGLIGDEPFFRATRRLVYGRPDPKPGNFEPRFGSTNEFERIASEEAGRNLKWFFDVYLRHARLPTLVDSRNGSQLNLQWRTPAGLPFPMPVELLVDGKLQTVAMDRGKGVVSLPSPTSHVVIDPDGKLLRHSEAMDRYRAFTQAEAAKKAAAAK